MPERLRDQIVSQLKRQTLLSALPCFSTFPIAEIDALGDLLSEIQLQPDEMIVAENTLVDSVYILVAGEAEVTQLSSQKRRLSKKPKITAMPVAMLYSGEAIRLGWRRLVLVR